MFVPPLRDNRLEGIATSAATLEEISEAYIRGEIEACDLVTAYLKRPGAGACHAGTAGSLIWCGGFCTSPDPYRPHAGRRAFFPEPSDFQLSPPPPLSRVVGGMEVLC